MLEATVPTMGRDVCIPIDESEHSIRALSWAVKNVLQPRDRLHLVTVTQAVAGPYPAEVVDTDVPAPTSTSVNAWKNEQAAIAQQTANLLDRLHAEARSLGVPEEAIKTVQLPPQGGASGVGASVVKYAESAEAKVVVVGSRGMGGWKKAMASMLGLGSVSEYILEKSTCPVVVVKPNQSKR